MSPPPLLGNASIFRPLITVVLPLDETLIFWVNTSMQREEGGNEPVVPSLTSRPPWDPGWGWHLTPGGLHGWLPAMRDAELPRTPPPGSPPLSPSCSSPALASLCTSTHTSSCFFFNFSQNSNSETCLRADQRCFFLHFQQFRESAN